MEKILCDINIILDVLLKREPFFSDSYKIFEKIQNGEINGYISASSIDTIFYILRRNNKSIEESKKIISTLVSLFSIATVDFYVIEKALSLDIKDFEDAIVYKSADNEGCEIILTRNEKDFPKGDIEILSPTDFLLQN